jgi:hypothetical protein
MNGAADGRKSLLGVQLGHFVGDPAHEVARFVTVPGTRPGGSFAAYSRSAAFYN